jgi:hypothetical protein
VNYRASCVKHEAIFPGNDEWKRVVEQALGIYGFGAFELMFDTPSKTLGSYKEFHSEAMAARCARCASCPK